MSLRNRKGRKPTWRHTKATGRLERSGKGGLDWYRYSREILQVKLIPFAIEQKAKRPGIVVQEDNAPPHIHPQSLMMYTLSGIHRLLWPGNSPDLNAIEKAWAYLKRRITARGAPKSKKDLQKAWIQAWKELPIAMVRKWIEAIPRHIQEVIKLHGGNGYAEGRGQGRSYKGLRKIGQLSYHSYLAQEGQQLGNEWIDEVEDEENDDEEKV